MTNGDILVNCTMTVFICSMHVLAGDTLTNIRLVNGTRGGQGRVEVEHAGLWGTICNGSFDLSDASVVCRSLGYPGAESTHSTAQLEGDMLIWLNNLSCNGSENTLVECPGIVWGAQTCFQSESAAVTCSGTVYTLCAHCAATCIIYTCTYYPIIGYIRLQFLDSHMCFSLAAGSYLVTPHQMTK